MGERKERFYADVSLAALDAANVVPVQPGTLRQFFLAESLGEPLRPNLPAESYQIWVRVHPRTVAAKLVPFYTRSV